MGLLGVADPEVLPTDALTGIAYGIIKILACGATGIVLAGIVMSCLCDLFECRKLRGVQGRSEVWPLIL